MTKLKRACHLASITICVASLLACDEVQDIQVQNAEQRADFARKGWLPVDLPLPARLIFDLDTNKCTILAPATPPGTNGPWLERGEHRWRIESSTPAQLSCESGGLLIHR